MSVKKYQKRPVIVEAIQWTGDNARDMFDFLTENKMIDKHMAVIGDNFYIDHNKVRGGLVVRTLELECIVNIGEFVVKGPSGEFYPVKADIFRDCYDSYYG